MAYQRRSNAGTAHANGDFAGDREAPPALRMTTLPLLPADTLPAYEVNFVDLSPSSKIDAGLINTPSHYDENDVQTLNNILGVNGCAAHDKPLFETPLKSIAGTRSVTVADTLNPRGTLPSKAPKKTALEHDEELDSTTTGHFLTVMNMIKANVGTGILAIPLAFSHSGLIMGVVYMIMLVVICVDCMHMVVRASHHFKRGLEKPQMTYPEVAMLAFRHSPLRRMANGVRLSVVVFLTITQLGVCCVYVVFVSRTIENVLEDYHTMFNIRLLELISGPAFLLLVMVRQMKSLAAIMMLANIITLAALFCVWQEVVRHLLPFSSLPQIGGLADFARFFSTAVYAFEGIGCVLPVQNKMTNPDAFGGTFGVLNQAMIVVALLYVITGFFGYWGFGNAVQGSITYSLPAQPIYVAVKIGMAVAVFFSYGLQFYVPIKMASITMRMRWKKASDFRLIMAEYGIRIGLMVFTLLLALFIPYLSLFIDLIGAFGGSYLALILPPVIDLVYRYDMKVETPNNAASVPHRRYGIFYWILIKDVAFLLFGLAGFGLGTYLAVHDIVAQFIKDASGGGTAAVSGVTNRSAGG